MADEVFYTWTTPDGNETFEAKFTSAMLDVAMRWVEFGEYGSEQGACKALRRRCPGLASEEYVAALQEAKQLLEMADRCLKPHAEELVKQGMGELERSLVREFETRMPGLSRVKYCKALFWVYWSKYRE